jgi:hypothetical protein
VRRRLLVALALGLALTACGRLGPPVRSRPEPTPATQPQATPSADEEQDPEETSP